MLVKMEELKNVVELGSNGMVLLIANEAEEIGSSFQNTSLCAQDASLLDNGAITIDIDKDAIFLSEKAYITNEGIPIFNVKCTEDFIRNKDIPFLFSDLLNLCMVNGYEIFRCHLENSEKERVVTIAFSMSLSVLGNIPDELKHMNVDLLKTFMEELIPFLDSINEETIKQDNLESFGYEIHQYKKDDTDKAYLEIDPVTQGVVLKYVTIEKITEEK